MNAQNDMMVAMGATTLISWEDFLQIPDGPEQVELLEGELISMPPPERKHMEIVERLFLLLKEAIDRLRTSGEAPVGRIHIEMGYLLTSDPRSWLRPDVTLTHPNQPGDQFYEGAPLLVFEVVSENDRASHLNRKVRQLLNHGAREVWLIYPETRDAYIYREGLDARRETAAIRTDILPGGEIALERIFEE